MIKGLRMIFSERFPLFYLLHHNIGSVKEAREEGRVMNLPLRGRYLLDLCCEGMLHRFRR